MSRITVGFRWWGGSSRQARAHAPSRRPDRRRRRPGLWQLEERCLLAPAPVDVGPTAADLIAAIDMADQTTGAVTLVLPANTSYMVTGPDNSNTNKEDNNWYGPNGLPAIDNTITIEGNGSTISACPAASNPCRLFYVSGGINGELPLGSLTLENLTLSGGVAQGGAGGAGGGGGMGAGGAIFNQGTLVLIGVTLTGNAAQGGAGASASSVTTGGGGGMGSAASLSGAGGGFGGNFPGTFGGSGGQTPNDGGGGGGGGFLTGSSGGNNTSNAPGAGGGAGAFGGAGDAYSGEPGGAPGDGGGGGGGSTSFNEPGGGGAFGLGGNYGTIGGGGGGGGVGGGGGAGSDGGGGGGFGGGGGDYGGNGGFGGGGGGNGGSGGAGLGGNGGSGTSGAGGGGAGLGGAIFNMGATGIPGSGVLTIINCTLTNNTARGGASGGGGNGGGGFGGAIFNLDGSVTINDSTLASNTVAGGASSGGSVGPADGGAVDNLAFGNIIQGNGTNIQPGGAESATVTLYNSILSNTNPGSSAKSNRQALLSRVVTKAETTSGHHPGRALARREVVLPNKRAIRRLRGKVGGATVTDLASSAISGNHTNTASITGSKNLVESNDVAKNGITPGVITKTADPKLGKLKNNGGPTLTLAILPGSPAYGAGDKKLPGVPATDQRGLPRVLKGRLDLGAFEVQSKIAAPTPRR